MRSNRTFTLWALAAVAAGSGSNVAFASSDDDFIHGGILQQGIDALQSALSPGDADVGAFQMQVISEETSPVLGFTPRFAGVPIDLIEGASVEHGSLLRARVSAPGSSYAQGRALSLVQSHDLGLVEVDLSASAGYVGEDDQDYGQSSTFGLGGGLTIDSLGGLRLDAFYSSRQDETFGFARDQVTAGVGYGFGVVDTRLSVSSVSQYDSEGVPTDEQQVWALGGQMQLGSSWVVGGDLAYSTALDGTEATSGVVNFRFNF